MNSSIEAREYDALVSSVISVPYLEMTVQIITNIDMLDTFTPLAPQFHQAPLTLKFIICLDSFCEI